ncbi:hypothetical protein [Pantoea allii]|uniref:hypothetical protein n=1 Tax=Pantoea allii TaxID=574096 RepID=UPI0024B6A82C|nr:hypothetical protein [Pantoea allii]MDJ0087671.1 hypothetical protein [Pantoea allii]
MSELDGGPAFPVPDSEYQFQDKGMTLRDYFAAKAMQSFLISKDDGNYHLNIDDVAGDAYSVADAMLRARGQ